MSDEPIGTLDNDKPVPPGKILVCLRKLANGVDAIMGTRNGPTALYWELLAVVQKHARGRPEKSE